MHGQVGGRAGRHADLCLSLRTTCSLVLILLYLGEVGGRIES